MESSLLIAEPKTYAYWWTFVPVMPADREDPAYAILKRQWADHTMNCLAPEGEGWRLKSNRGFYVEQREDHISTVLFHIWAAFPDASWVGPFLDLWDIPHGDVKGVRWSYSWEQRSEGAKRPDITDVVLSWEDQHGAAVVVIETKRTGGKLSEKDTNGGRRYMNMPSIRPFARKFMVFLVDQRDIAAAVALLPQGTPVCSWQSLGKLQAELAGAFGGPVGLLNAYVAKHYADLRMPIDVDFASSLNGVEFTGTAERYLAVRSLGLPSAMERFLIGSEVAFSARTGRMPEPPYSWLAEDPSFPEVVAAKAQSRQDREKPLWRLSPR